MKCPALCPLCAGALHGKIFPEWYDLAYHINKCHPEILEKMYEQCHQCRVLLLRLVAGPGLIVRPVGGMQKLYRHWKRVGLETHLLEVTLA